ncbi:MAG: SAM-dependent chlorinase/fluorinase [Thiohalocapsa sp.]
MKLHDPPRRIALITDFGGGPYVGQMGLVLSALADVPTISVVSDLPAFRPELAAFLLPGLRHRMPKSTLYLCVVDPGVGGERGVLAAAVDGDWLVGPDNGLLLPCIRRDPNARVFRVDWRPEQLSDSFHGRDLFAPIAAFIVGGHLPRCTTTKTHALVGADWPSALPKVCYVDHYGNLITGVDADQVSRDEVLRIGPHDIRFARTFCEMPPGIPFWYRNALGLVEIAVNQRRADRLLNLSSGDDLPLPRQ